MDGGACLVMFGAACLDMFGFLCVPQQRVVFIPCALCACFVSFLAHPLQVVLLLTHSMHTDPRHATVGRHSGVCSAVPALC